MSHLVLLPSWKVYIYNLARRWKLFKGINLGIIKLTTRKETLLIQNLLKRFGKGEILFKLKCFILEEYVKTCEENQSRLSEEEYALAVKISKIKNLHLKDLQMEMSELKKFGKIVGLTFSDMKGMDEESLIYKILGKVDPEQNYDSDFVEWYSSLDESYFNNAEKKENGEDMNFDELIEAIEDASDDMDTLKEIYEMEEYEDIFDAKKLKKLKDTDSLATAMLEAIESVMNGDSDDKEEDKEEAAEDKAEASDNDEVSDEDLLEAVNEAEDLESLKEIYKEFKDKFEGVSTRGKIKFETLKENMLSALGEGGDEEDPEKLLEKWEAMDISELKALAKEKGIKVKLGMKKDAIIEALAETVVLEEESEIEINQSQVLEWVKNKDIDSLNKCADSLGINLSTLAKKNSRRAGDAIIEFLASSGKEEKTPKEKKEPPKEKVRETIFGTVEKMVGDGAEDDDIVSKVYPMLKEKGVSMLDAKKKVKQLIEIAKL